MTSAHADEPAPVLDVQANAGISYSTKLVDGKNVVSTLKNGIFQLEEQPGLTPEDPKTTLVNVKDTQGATVITFPLAYNVAGVTIPVKSEIKEDGRVLEIVPEKPANFTPGTATLVAKPIASAEENQRAMGNFSTQFGLATGIGSFIGGAVGAAVGCVVTIVAGCVPGLVAGFGIGGILGTIAVGGPALLASGVELMETMQAPDGTSRWAK
ncbi:hypothetical protein [Nocardia sp. NPDC005978]|uniref:hypothetical protein n=1 Tax=unclassified Nocardia TaxID=2637762 RepID=UPI0033AFDB15